MLYIYIGTDTAKVREAAHAKLESETTAGKSVERVSAEEYVPGLLRDLIEAQSLFGEGKVVLLDSPSEEETFWEDVVALAPAMAESPHTFICLDGGLKAAEKRTLAKHAEILEEFSAEKTERFNVFSLTDALVKRDKKQLWTKYTEAVQAGVSPEEIIGTLFWQIKTLRLVARSKNATDAGVKPFVYAKAHSALERFTENELDELSRELLIIYHDGHAGRADISAALEAWTLKK